eukprot:6734122-Prymnesium_polylepis.1
MAAVAQAGATGSSSGGDPPEQKLFVTSGASYSEVNPWLVKDEVKDDDNKETTVATVPEGVEGVDGAFHRLEGD